MTEELNKKILTAAATGDTLAFRQVVEAYQSLVYNLAYRYVYNCAAAEDMAQECFVRLYQNFGQYNLSRPLRPWLIRLCTNTCLNWLRKEKKHRTVEIDSENELRSSAVRLVGDKEDPSFLAESAEARSTVRKAVAALPAEYKAVVNLRYFEGLEYREIAKMLQVPLGTVKIRLFRARDILKRTLGRSAPAVVG